MSHSDTCLHDMEHEECRNVVSGVDRYVSSLETDDEWAKEKWSFALVSENLAPGFCQANVETQLLLDKKKSDKNIDLKRIIFFWDISKWYLFVCKI